MAQETFFNLPGDKRARIINAALSAFSQKGYYQTSVEEIAKSAGVSKGSMYQYFSGKKGLYLFIVEYGADLKVQYFRSKALEGEYTNFFQVIDELLASGLAYSQDHPYLSRLYQSIHAGIPKDIEKEIRRITEEKGRSQYRQLIYKAIAHKDIRDDVDPEFLSFYLYALMNQFGTWIITCSGGHTDIQTAIHNFTSLLRKGLEKRRDS
ncbi:MAG: TetR/AcrR family transcriptional regulator [Spirochaetia bacterium]